ncbi:CPBP family intramembrane glutamic endopeptidase [Rhodococcoides yunnanense]|uniref:CPBP family intramembrane glutamic endopeptidase n=1 Tax=Rhodococcoides yunnanense TaxID=278209 RepID=UPI0022B0B12D|nr:CPBP family intramembrane glutamic endopeptidase [Rhodococcus yunnanensis]MCZ4278532.1 CPBP family intramembrane metalloprotease [Rhodococcus yunnanensis]
MNRNNNWNSSLYIAAVPLGLAAAYLVVCWPFEALVSVQRHLGAGSEVVTESTPPTMPGAQIGFLILFFAAVAGLALVAAVRRFIEPNETEPNSFPGTWRTRTLMSAGLFPIGLCMASLLSPEDAENLSRTSDYGNPAQWWNSAHLLVAGSAEEPFFSALPVLLLFGVVGLVWRVQPWMLGIVIASSALFRASIHLYQGTGQALSAFVWGAVAVYVYYRLRSLTGLVLAHTAWNAFVIANNGDYTAAQIVIGGCIAFTALWSIYRLSNTSTFDHSDRACPTAAAGHTSNATSEGHR